jgi:hypothetical protein
MRMDPARRQRVIRHFLWVSHISNTDHGSSEAESANEKWMAYSDSVLLVSTVSMV